MKRWLPIVMLVALMLGTVPSPTSAAPPQFLPEIGYKFYYMLDLVFVDFVNPYFTPVNGVIVNMIVRDGSKKNKVVAIGQTRMPTNLTLKPGEHTSARVPIRARIMRDIPVNATFEFRITGKVADSDSLPPAVVVQGGGSMDVNKDDNGVPYVMGFATIDPLAEEDASVQIQMAILTFYDSQHRIVWSEIMALSGALTHGDSMMVFAKYDAAASVDTNSVDVQFVTAAGGT